MKGRVYQKIKGGNWSVDYFVNGRRVREMVAPNKKLAEAILNKRLADIAENKHLDVKKEQKIKFKDVAHTYMETHSKPLKRSWKTDENCLKPLLLVFGEKYLYEITPKMIEEYKIARSKVVSSIKKKQICVATVNKELSALRAIWNKAIHWEMTDRNPMDKVKLYKENNQRLRFLEKEEIEKLLKYSSHQLRAIILIALHTGMRKGEIQSLKWSDLNYQQSYIKLNLTKNGEIRYVPLNQVAKEVFLSTAKHPESAYIFCDADGQSFNFRKAFETAIGKTGIKDFRFHDLRHTFASHMRMAGVDLHTIGELLGHKSIEMTKRYAHLSPDAKVRAVEVLSNKIGTVLAPKASTREEENTQAVVTQVESTR